MLLTAVNTSAYIPSIYNNLFKQRPIKAQILFHFFLTILFFINFLKYINFLLLFSGPKEFVSNVKD